MKRIKSSINIIMYLGIPLLFQIGIIFFYRFNNPLLSSQESLQKASDFIMSINGMYVVMTPLLIVLFLFNNKYLKAKFLFSFSILKKSITQGLIGTLFMYAMLIIFGLTIQVFNLKLPLAENQDLLNNMVKGTPFLLSVLLLVFITPLIEEIIFRVAVAGVLIEDKVKKSWLPYILMAIIFALIHDSTVITSFSQGSVLIFMQYFTLSFSLSVIYKKTDHNILAVYIAHLINNFVMLLIM